MSEGGGSKPKKTSTAKNLVAGGLAGAIEATIMYPTEFVKTQLQLASKAQGTPPFTTPLGCLKYTVETRGVFGLYSGLSTLVVGSIPKAAVRFAAFNELSNRMKGPDGKLSTTSTMLAGLGAGIFEAIIAVTPMETVKTKMIDDKNRATPRYRGLVHGVTTIVKEDGIAGVYAGVVPTMLKQGANQAVRFAIYGRIKALICGDSGQITTLQSMLTGSLAGFVSVYATMPFDVVKTRMQGLEAKNYTGTLNCFTSVVKNDGVLALWKGTTPRLGRVMFSGGIIFACYEAIIKALAPVWPDPE
ncbi:Mitochondrial carrier protein [Plasmodiophora brassicae]